MGPKNDGNRAGAGSENDEHEDENGHEGQGQREDDRHDDDGDDLDNLLEDDEDDDGDEEDDDADDDGDDDEQDDKKSGLTTGGVQKMIDSALDRRINVVLKEIRKERGGNGKRGQSDDRRGSERRDLRQTSTSPSSGDVREARSAYREYVGDEISFLGSVEREHAMSMARGLLSSKLADGTDPDDAGREVATEVASSIRALRKHYEKKTVAALRRRGVLDKGAPGQPPKGKRSPGGESSFAAGKAKAEQMFGDRIKE